MRLGADQGGMTLAEILVAIAIIGIGLAALAAAIPLAGYGIQEGSQLSTATFLANARLEQARNATWTATPAADNLGVSSGDTAPQSGGVTTLPDETPVAAPYSAYTRRVRIVNCGAGAGCGGIVDANLRQVTVTVTYTPLTGIGQSPTTKAATVTILIAKR
jgi:prepilin-type N-terminal cleavage/methylation domain-containing protein